MNPNIENITADLRALIPNSIIRYRGNNFEVGMFREDVRVIFHFTFYEKHYPGSPKWAYNYEVEDRFVALLEDYDALRFYSELNETKNSVFGVVEYEVD